MSKVSKDPVELADIVVNSAKKNDKEIKRPPLHEVVIEKKYEELGKLCRDSNTEINQQDMNGLTALHWAVEKHDEQSIELISSHPDVNINIEDERGWTPLHWAVEKNNMHAILFLCNKPGINLNAKNKVGFSPLHLAVEKSNNDALRLLCKQENVIINARSNWGSTPFHVSVTSNNKEAILILFNSSADALNDVTDIKTTALSIAASSCNQDICKVLAFLKPALVLDMDNSEQAATRRKERERNPNHKTQLFGLGNEEARIFLKKNPVTVEYHDVDNVYRSSGINLMIENMPDLVEEILDRSILEIQVLTQSKDNENSQLYEDRIIFDFSALEPYHVNMKCKKKDFGCTAEVCICSSTFEQVGKDYDAELYNYDNNPLEVMIKGNHFQLLTHPVVEALIKRKWESFARLYFFLATFLIYIFFISMLITYELSQIRPSEGCSNSKTISDCSTVKSKACIVSGYIVLILSICRLFLEILDFFHEIFKEYKYMNSRNLKSLVIMPVIRYFGKKSNIMELLVYGTAASFSWNVTNDDILSSFEWQIGSFCVFLAFLHLLSIIRILAVVGIYVTMFLQILWTFVAKIGLLLGIFVGLFLIIFEMLSGNSPIFSESKLSLAALYKTFSMGVSGVAYEDYEIEDVTLQYPIGLFLALIIFVIMVPILFLNLATGLAIEDIGQIRSNSDAKKNAAKIKQIYHSEKILMYVQNSILFMQGLFFCRTKGLNLLGLQKRFYSRPSHNLYWKKKIKQRSIGKYYETADLLKKFEELRNDFLSVKEELRLQNI